MPKVLWLSTALILISSMTMEVSRRSLRQQRDKDYGRWLIMTVALGLAFLATQLFAWRQLVRQGVYLASNPYNSFFYLFTAAHGLHLLGGILALGYLLLRTTRRRSTVEGELRRAGAADAADAATIYWHFMDGLWVALFLLLHAPARRQFARPGFYLAMAISLLGLLPVVIWNQQNGWITLTHLNERSGLNQAWTPT